MLEAVVFTLQILHASDLEGGVHAIEDAPKFAAIVDVLEDQFPNTVILSAGDNYLPGPFLSAAGDRETFRDGGLFNAAYNALFGLPSTHTMDAYAGLREGAGRLDISIMNIIGFDASAVGNHEFDLGSDAFAHIIEGQLEGEGRNLLRDEQLALYDRGGDVMRFHALEDSEFLVLGGQPLNEPLVSYGPFVMNSQDQINACIRNYRSGKMGQL